MDGSLTRDDVWVTTKIFHFSAGICLNSVGNTFVGMGDPNADVKKEMNIAFEMCLKEMNLGYVDCLLMHWPSSPETKDADLARK